MDFDHYVVPFNKQVVMGLDLIMALIFIEGTGLEDGSDTGNEELMKLFLN